MSNSDNNITDEQIEMVKSGRNVVVKHLWKGKVIGISIVVIMIFLTWLRSRGLI